MMISQHSSLFIHVNQFKFLSFTLHLAAETPVIPDG